MIDSVYELQQTVAINANVMFNSDVVRTASANCCGWLEHESASGMFTLTKSGIYEISFNCNISGPSAGEVELCMNANGEELSGTTMQYTVESASVAANVGCKRLVRVCGGSKTITISNNGSLQLTTENANIIIKKVA